MRLARSSQPAWPVLRPAESAPARDGDPPQRLAAGDESSPRRPVSPLVALALHRDLDFGLALLARSSRFICTSCSDTYSVGEPPDFLVRLVACAPPPVSHRTATPLDRVATCRSTRAYLLHQSFVNPNRTRATTKHVSSRGRVMPIENDAIPLESEAPSFISRPLSPLGPVARCTSGTDRPHWCSGRDQTGDRGVARIASGRPDSGCTSSRSWSCAPLSPVMSVQSASQQNPCSQIATSGTSASFWSAADSVVMSLLGVSSAMRRDWFGIFLVVVEIAILPTAAALV